MLRHKHLKLCVYFFTDLLLEKWGKDQVPAALKGQETKVHFANHEVTVTSELDFASTGLVLGDNKVLLFFIRT